MRLARAMIFVKDIDRMAAFYTDVLGFKAIESTRLSNWVEFESGLSLHAIPRQIAENIVIASPPRPRETGAVKLFFEVADPEAERPKLAALGIQILERPWGGWDAVDPEGNVFQLCQA
jgi:catechol 2,3-dioxygenase-like lactoylglutathione lyase family enzyme